MMREEQKEMMRENERRRREKREYEEKLVKKEAEMQRTANQIGEEMEKQRLQELESKKRKMHKIFVQ